jgi:AraC-like DNA-binding protein
MRALFIEGIVLQFLALKSASAAAGSAALLSRGERVGLHRARDALLADMRNPPGVTELAGLAGLSEAALNQGFRRLFGGTVYEVLRDHRLDHARIALETTGIPVKQIAHGVGYNHVTNFINAFTRRYGAPPRRYARAVERPAGAGAVAR